MPFQISNLKLAVLNKFSIQKAMGGALCGHYVFFTILCRLLFSAMINFEDIGFNLNEVLVVSNH